MIWFLIRWWLLLCFIIGLILLIGVNIGRSLDAEKWQKVIDKKQTELNKLKKTCAIYGYGFTEDE